METNTLRGDPPTILKKGALKKAPPLSRFNGFKTWKNRYFMLLRLNPNSHVLLRKSPKKGSKEMQKLHTYYLVYWENEDVKKRPLRAIPIQESHQVRMFATYENENNMVSLVTNERIFFFVAPNENEMKSWYQHLATVIRTLREQTNNQQMSFEFPDDVSQVQSHGITNTEEHFDYESIFTDLELDTNRSSVLSRQEVKQSDTTFPIADTASSCELPTKLHPQNTYIMLSQHRSEDEETASISRHGTEPSALRSIIKGIKGKRPHTIAVNEEMRSSNDVQEYCDPYEPPYMKVQDIYESLQTSKTGIGEGTGSTDASKATSTVHEAKDRDRDDAVECRICGDSMVLTIKKSGSTSQADLKMEFGDYEVTVKRK